MKRIIMAFLVLLYVMLPSCAVFAQTEEDAGLAAEINSDEASSEASVQGMENAMDVGSSDMND